MINSPLKSDAASKKPLPDYESIQINVMLTNLRKDKQKSEKVFHCPLIGLKVYLYSSVALTKDKSYKVIHRAKENSRANRARPENSEKNAAP